MGDEISISIEQLPAEQSTAGTYFIIVHETGVIVNRIGRR